MKVDQKGNKNLQEVQNGEIFNFNIPPFLNDSEKNKQNQISNEEETFGQIEQCYELTRNNNYASKDFNDLTYKIFEENDDQNITNKNTGETERNNTINNLLDNNTVHSNFFDDEKSYNNNFSLLNIK